MSPQKKGWQAKLDAELKADPDKRATLDRLCDEWVEREQRMVRLAPTAFKYVEWAIVFGALNFAWSLASGFDRLGLTLIQAALGLLVFWHFLNKYFSIPKWFKRRDRLWTNILTWRLPALLLASLIAATLVLAIGWRLSLLLQQADRHGTSESRVNPAVTSLALKDMPTGSKCFR